MPERSFGSNQVDFGGMIPPLSATANSSAREVAYIENAIPRARSALRSSSSVPRIPPTNSISASVRGSVMLKSGERTWSCNNATSNESTAESLVGDNAMRYQLPAP